MEAATSQTGMGNRQRARLKSPRSTKVWGQESWRETQGGREEGAKDRTAGETGHIDIPSGNEMNREKERGQKWWLMGK